jgi:hypothetical protein
MAEVCPELWLLLPNVAATLLAVAHQSPAAMLAFCGGNGFWIAASARRDADTTFIRVCLSALAIALGGLAVAWLTEPLGTLNDGMGWDGRHYAAMYSYFSTGTYAPISPEFPYTQRVALPFLAAHLPFSARASFLLLHGAFWCVTMVLFAACGRSAFGIRRSSILFGVLWLQVLWVSIPRAVAVYSFAVDSAALCFVQAWILLLVSRRACWLLPLCAFVGVLFKETMLLVVGLSVVSLLALWRLPRFRSLLPPELASFRSSAVASVFLAVLAAVGGQWIASHTLPAGHRIHGSEIHTLYVWLLMRVNDPIQVLRYAAAGFAVYGGFAALQAAIVGKPAAADSDWTLPFTAILCALYLGVSFLAGTDLTRFAYMAFPFAMPLLLSALDDVPRDYGVLAVLLGLPAAHAFTPVAPVLAGHDLPSLDLDGLYSWAMEYAHPALVGAWIAWWLACILLLRSLAFTSTWRLRTSEHQVSRAQSELRGEEDK